MSQLADLIASQKRLANLPTGTLAATPGQPAQASNAYAPWVFPPDGFLGFDPVSV